MSPSLLICFRSLVMLLCLLVVPSMAISGLSPPELGGRVADWCRWLVDEVSRWQGPIAVAPDMTPSSASTTANRANVGLHESNSQQPRRVRLASFRSDDRLSGSISPIPVVASGRSLVPRDRVRPTSSARMSDDQQSELLARLEGQLRRLGAVRFQLDRWGDQHRCVCDVALDGDGRLTRHFQHVHPNALACVMTVLEQVEGWKQGR